MWLLFSFTRSTISSKKKKKKKKVIIIENRGLMDRLWSISRRSLLTGKTYAYLSDVCCSLTKLRKWVQSLWAIFSVFVWKLMKYMPFTRGLWLQDKNSLVNLLLSLVGTKTLLVNLCDGTKNKPSSPGLFELESWISNLASVLLKF